MLTFILSMISIVLFWNTPFREEWSRIMIGGDQMLFSASTLVIFTYLIIGCGGLISWYWRRRV